MKVTLTGATGFIGSHIVSELQAHGHDVTALVRGAAQADVAADRSAAAIVTDLYDRSAVARQLAGADAAIHTAGHFFSKLHPACTPPEARRPRRGPPSRTALEVSVGRFAGLSQVLRPGRPR
jgi:uncharacterized protein YbjT (DUF2867 family)